VKFFALNILAVAVFCRKYISDKKITIFPVLNNCFFPIERSYSEQSQTLLMTLLISGYIGRMC